MSVCSIVFLLNIFFDISLPLVKVYVKAKYDASDIVVVIACLQYYAGWADKIQGKTIEVTTSTCQ